MKDICNQIIFISFLFYVLYQVKKCLAETNKYGSWPETDPGVTVDLGCKKQEEKGSYSRRCGSDGSWEEVTGACEIDPEVLNEIDEELQGLANSDEDISEDLENILKNLTELTGTVDGDTSVTSMTRLVGTAQSVVDVIESSKTVTEQGTKEFLQLMDDVIKPETEETWQKVSRDLSLTVENIFSWYGSNVAIDEGNSHDTEIGKSDAGVKFPSKIQADNSIEIPAASLASKGITDTCFGGTSFKSIGNLINGGSSSDGSVESVDTSQVVNSEIVSAILPQKSGVSYTNLDPPVVVTFKPKNKTFTKPVCVFWDFNALGPGQKGAWSTDGCSLKEETADNVVCQCSHLTNFAVLMSPSGVDSKHSQILSIISAVGCAISMVCLILTIVAHAVVWRLVRSDRAIVLMNLCVALFVALGMFLAGVNRTESKKACAAIAAIIQYLFLAVFFFMLLIGIEILICVVHVFVTKFRIKVLLPVAWVVPAVIVGISLGVTKAEGYGNDKFCWLDIESGLIWSFIGPAAFIICINFIIILIVFKKMASSAVLKSKTSSIKIKTGLRSLCVLLPLMGLTWVFGILSVNSSMFFLQYLFCIFNTLQGLFIFLFHCVFNRQIREAIKRRQERKKSLQTLSSDLRKQSRSFSKDEKRRKSGDRRTSDIKQNGIGNKAFTGKDERELSKDYDADDWDKVERKMYHKNIRRGSKLWR
ncbi:adhesion G protein-coupled receptor L3-like [Ruditapes philippinarum]|uniref:adhesion G protein-coupled receptor L3-like n=1 Tax=Ruditapes philippinarum TaxID=129788 RepID=UPI00295C16B1|nr:adhesion G protein-coupled receptor L3-like [Ruditapes philippinarum]